jgi:hypothetical protein
MFVRRLNSMPVPKSYLKTLKCLCVYKNKLTAFLHLQNKSTRLLRRTPCCCSHFHRTILFHVLTLQNEVSSKNTYLTREDIYVRQLRRSSDETANYHSNCCARRQDANKKHTIRDKKNTFRSCHRRELGRAGGGVFTFLQIEFWLSAGRRAGGAKASNSREYGIKLKAIFASAKRAAHRTELLYVSPKRRFSV